MELESEDVLLQALLILNIPDHHFHHYNLLRGSAVTGQDGVMVHVGEWITYLKANRQIVINVGEWITYLNANRQECISILKEGLIIVPKNANRSKLLLFINLLVKPKCNSMPKSREIVAKRHFAII